MAINYSDFEIKNRVNNLLGRKQNNAEVSEETGSLFPKIRNPFANKYIVDNADRISTANMSNAAKTLFSAATGREINDSAVSADSNIQQETYTPKAIDSNSLGSLDVATELPKLSEKQISGIIKQYFGKSKIMSENDAKGIYDAQNQTGMSALAMLGIGALESGYGTSNIANKTNNIWGYGATNINPEGNAHRYSQMSEGAKQFANEFMKTYYNGYGAKSINSAGTGSNPKGMGYAYNDDGTISSTWAPQVSDIMSRFYNTAKSFGNFGNTTNNADTAKTEQINKIYGKNKANSYTKGSEFFTLTPQNISLLRNTSTVKTNTPVFNVQNNASDSGVVSTAKKYLGTPYVWGGTTPKGFDCSGLVQYAFAQNGKKVPRTSQEQFKGGTAVNQNNLQSGDLVFFKGSDGTSTAPGHVGIYIGNGQYIQAPKTGDVVKISNMSDRRDYVGARRY